MGDTDAAREQDAEQGQSADQQAERSVDEAVLEGSSRVDRSLWSVMAVGVTGGVDVGLGLLAAVLVLDRTGDQTLAALAFGVGFVLLVVGKSELFTENFLVPVAALVAGRASASAVLRLWSVTFVGNLIGGGMMMGLIVLAFPDFHGSIAEMGSRYALQGVTVRAAALALLAGAAITVLTWIERVTSNSVTHAVAAYVTGFLLLLGPLSHSVVGSVEMIGGLLVGAPFGVGDAAISALLMIVGNAVGGIGLVTVLRLVRADNVRTSA